MSGTSGDGVDASVINSDGKGQFKVLINKYFQYTDDISENIYKLKKNINKIKAKIITNDNDKVSLSIREVDGNPFDELNGKVKGDIVTCNVIETGDFGLKIRIGENGPVSIIKRSELALRKSDARPERWAKNDKLDAAITSIDQASYKITLSVRTMEETTEREAMEKYGCKRKIR